MPPASAGSRGGAAPCPAMLPCSSGGRGLWALAPQGWPLLAAPKDGGDWGFPVAELLMARLDAEAGCGPWGCMGTCRAAPGAHAAEGAVWGA